MIVVDVNVIAYLWIPGELTALTEKAHRKDPDWVAPLLWRSEFQNLLAGYLRREALTFDTTNRCLQGAEAQFSGSEFRVPSHLVMNEVAHSRCSAYDCEYVALAKDLGVSLLTADKQVIREFPDRAIGLRNFLEPM